jgi:hypothetical protein
MSSTDIELENEHGCFQSVKSRKRKHSEMEDNSTKGDQKSLLSVLKEKLGFKSSHDTASARKSILSPSNHVGEQNLSFQPDNNMSKCANLSFNIDTNKGSEEHEIPRKRVKFDEENLIFSSITYQRQNAVRMERENARVRGEQVEEKSLLSRFINFTANLF